MQDFSTWPVTGLVAPLWLRSVFGVPVLVPDPHRLVHLQLRRFAGCPVCSLHLRSMARRHHEIATAGIAEVVVFASALGDLLPYAADLPFPLIADPTRALYRRFGLERSARAVLDPRAWAAALRGLGSARLPGRLPTDLLGLPGDLLIAPDGAVLAVHQGRHADDQWSVDDLLALAAASPSRQTR